MPIEINGVTVINDSRGLENITDGLAAEVKKPVITFPANGSSGFDAISAPNIRVTAPYFSLYGENKASSEIQISVNSDFSSPIVNATENGTDTTFDYDNVTYSFATSTVYYARVRHTDVNSNVSEWSDSVSFTTPSSFTFANQPSITSPTNNATEVLGNPTITSSAFATTPTGQDSHVSSDWQVATDSSFSTIVDSSTADTSNLTSYTVATTLATSTVHYVRVRYNGSTYTSEWSDTIAFTTKASYVEYWTVLTSDVEAWGGSYQHPVGTITDDAGNHSALVSGQRSNSFEIHRIGANGEDEGRIEYGSPITASSTYSGGFAQLSTTLAAAGGHYNSGDTAYINFLDISQGGLSNSATYNITATGYGTMRGIDPGHMSPGSSSTSVYAMGGIVSSYNGYYLYELTSSGTIPYWNRVYLPSGTMFPRGMTTLSTGHVIVVATYRDTGNQEWLGFVVHTPTTLQIEAAYFIVNQADSSWTGGNNSYASELSNGNVLIGDWYFVAEVNLNISGGTVGTPTIVRHLSISRSDNFHENSAGNIVVSSSQTTPWFAEYQPNGSSYDFVTGRQLIYPVSGSGSSDEIYGAEYNSSEDALYAAGRYYTGSQYNGITIKVPASLADLDSTGATWPNNTQFAWTSITTATSPGLTVGSFTPNLTNWQTTSGGSWALSNNTGSYQPSVSTISQTTTEGTAQTRIGGTGNYYSYE